MTPLTTEQILEDQFKAGMKEKDFQAFKRAYPTLCKVVDTAMAEFAATKAQQFAEWAAMERWIFSRTKKTWWNDGYEIVKSPEITTTELYNLYLEEKNP